MRRAIRGLGSGIWDRKSGCQEGDGDGKLCWLGLVRVGSQVWLRYRYIRANARNPRLLLHTIFWQWGAICVNADRNALEAGHSGEKLIVLPGCMERLVGRCNWPDLLGPAGTSKLGIVGFENSRASAGECGRVVVGGGGAGERAPWWFRRSLELSNWYTMVTFSGQPSPTNEIKQTRPADGQQPQQSERGKREGSWS